MHVKPSLVCWPRPSTASTALDAIDSMRDIDLRGFTAGSIRPLIVKPVEGRGEPTATRITVKFAVTIFSSSGSVLVLRLACEPLRTQYQVLSLGVAVQTGSQTLGVLSRLCWDGERSGRDKQHEERFDISAGVFEALVPTWTLRHGDDELRGSMRASRVLGAWIQYPKDDLKRGSAGWSKVRRSSPVITPDATRPISSVYHHRSHVERE